MNKINKIIQNDFFLLFSRIIVGSMFLAVGISKLSDPAAAFANEIGNYRLMPQFISNFMAVTIPWIETVTGILLILGIRIKANSFIIGSLLFVFTISVASAMLRGLNIDCGCYSNIKAQPVGWKKIAENTSLILLAVNLFFSNKNRFSLEKSAINEYVQTNKSS